MSQLAAAPLRTAKQLQKLKEIRKVKAAIRWHERERRKRQAIAKERYESKRTALALQNWHKEVVADAKKKALKNAREDWLLGPLRPNRAVGHEAARYGALEPYQMRRPDIPVRVQKNRNEFRERKGLPPEYPLVVDDKKFFHIVQDDRVVVIRGREKNKIGVVDQVIEDSHEVTIKEVNKHYADSRVWNTGPEENVDPKREFEYSVPLSDVRLVIPYRITTYNSDGVPKNIYQDVIVDDIVMERHTTGIDPFTGIDYGKEEFPEEHRYDPETGLPIFHRYIAGTRRRIQWPWEKEEKIHSYKNDTKVVEKRGWRDRLRAHVANWKSASIPQRLGSLWGKRETEKMETAEEKGEPAERIDEDIEAAQEAPEKVKSQPDHKPADFDEDTGRNKVEDTGSLYATLVYPPFPNELSHELAPHIREARWQDAEDKKDSAVLQAKGTEQQLAESEEEEARQRRLDAMKTPMQLRWEVERAKKLEAEKAKPKVSTEALLMALGQHMKANGIKLTEKRIKAAMQAEVA